MEGELSIDFPELAAKREPVRQLLESLNAKLPFENKGIFEPSRRPRNCSTSFRQVAGEWKDIAAQIVQGENHQPCLASRLRTVSNYALGASRTHSSRPCER